MQSLKGKILNPALFFEEWNQMKNNFGLNYRKSMLKSEFTKSLFRMARLLCKSVGFYGQDISSLQIVWYWGF